MLDAIKAALDGYATVADLLSGGLYLHEDVGELGRNNTATVQAYDAAGFLQPCGWIYLDREQPDPDERGVVTVDFSIHLMQEHDYTVIEKARKLIERFLDYRFVEPLNADAETAVNAYTVRHIGNQPQVRHPVLRVPLSVTQFRVQTIPVGAIC